MAQKGTLQRNNDVNIKGRVQGRADAEEGSSGFSYLPKDQIHSGEPDCCFNLLAEISLMEED